MTRSYPPQAEGFAIVFGKNNEKQGKYMHCLLYTSNELGGFTMKKIKTLAAAAVVAVSLFSMQGDAMAAEANTRSVRGIALSLIHI